MNQRRMHGETSLDALQRAYQATQYRARALAECERLDRACDHAPAKMKQEALILARYYINRSR